MGFSLSLKVAYPLSFGDTMIAMVARGKSAQEIGAMGVWTSNWSMHIAASDPIANPRPTRSIE